MAPVELSSLSSNWKKLQKAIQSSPKSKSSATADAQDDPKSLKRKRSTKLSPEHAKEPKGSVKATKLSATRKRQKMEEPASVGASTRHHDAKSLSRSVSMPSLKQKPLLVDPEDIEKSVSILAPSPHHPDNENEGVSETALPGKYIALDCEMVGTGPEPDRDSALARVSVVNYHGHQVYDSYVQVKVPVTDFRTAVSGIEPKHLRKDYARPFKQVHDDLKTLLEGRILVGHAVKHDLDVLMLKHDKRFIRDTSKYSKFRDLATIPGRTPRLKTLAEKLLGVEIQVGAHSSVEDARATMALFRLEKEGFDQEVIKTYGHARMSIPSARADAGTDAVEGQSNRKPKNKKKKKKKN